jgi:hypothetical protein
VKKPKKRRTKTKKVTSPGRVAPQPRLSDSAAATSSPSPILRMFSHAWKIWTAVGAAVAVPIGVVTLVGPFWPTQPVFSPQPPAASPSAFDIRFNVENRSALFPIDELRIRCILREVTVVAEHSNLAIGTFVPPASGPNSIGSATTGVYKCPLKDLVRVGDKDWGEVLKEAELSFEATYRQWPFGHRTRNSEKFTLDSAASPPRWIKGKTLR